jgi:hypothetical protein
MPAPSLIHALLACIGLLTNDRHLAHPPAGWRPSVYFKSNSAAM